MSIRHFFTRSIGTSVTTVLLLASTPLNAEFELNFAPKSSSGSGGGGWGGSRGGSSSFSNVECGSSSTGGGNTGYGGDSSGGGGFGGGSFSLGRGCGTGYFLQEVGDGYFHVIVGDPADGFAIEWYMRSSGEYDTPLTTGYLDNIDDPLGSKVSDTGNGAGNPRTIHMREIIVVDGLDQEFIKTTNANKPKITQDIIASKLRSHFVVDMSNSTYDDSSTVGLITNTQEIIDTSIPEKSAIFDMSTASNSNVTAGLYSHSGGEFRDYSYAKDGYDVYSVKWIDYCNPDENPDHDCNIGGGNGGGGWSSSGGGGGWSGGGGW